MIAKNTDMSQAKLGEETYSSLEELTTTSLAKQAFHCYNLHMKKLSEQEEVTKLFEAGVHLGHKINRVHPRTKKYIYTVESGVSIIDLTKTVVNLTKAREFVSKLADDKKKLLVVVTKKIVAQAIRELCEKNKISYITVKWPAGLLTNFESIKKNILTLRDMKKEKESGDWDKYVKKEQTVLAKKMNRLNRLYGGLADLEKLPDALFVVDVKKEKNAIAEARRMKIPTIAIIDTNADPEKIEFPIMGNDDSPESIIYLVNEIVAAYLGDLK